jgi:hypothetical protein
MNIRNLKCKIGIHKYEMSRELKVYDIYPNTYDNNYKSPTRICLNCGKKQFWLPGYGGSELGCWI